MADHLWQRRPRFSGKQPEIRNKGGKGQFRIDVLFDAVYLPFVDDAGHKAAQHRRCHVVGVSFNRGSQRKHLPFGQLIPQQCISPQNARHNAGGTGAQSPGHGDIVALSNAQSSQRNAQLVIHNSGRTVHQIVGSRRHMRAVQRGDLNTVALLKGKDIVHRNCQAQRVEAGAHIGTGSRNAYVYQMRGPSLS